MTVWEKYHLDGITYLESRVLTRSQNHLLRATLKGRKSLTMKFAIFAVINLALSELRHYVYEFLNSSNTVGWSVLMGGVGLPSAFCEDCPTVVFKILWCLSKCVLRLVVPPPHFTGAWHLLQNATFSNTSKDSLFLFKEKCCHTVLSPLHFWSIQNHCPPSATNVQSYKTYIQRNHVVMNVIQQLKQVLVWYTGYRLKWLEVTR